jgi:hypothetical protein
MNKRTLIRNRTSVSVACSSLTAASPGAAFDGVMTNCSWGGICIELNRKFFVGSIVMIRVTGLIGGDLSGALPEGFKTITLAEVKWSKRLGQESSAGYVIGLKYLLN